MTPGLPSFAGAGTTTGYRPGCKIEKSPGGGDGLLGMAASLLGAASSDPWAECLTTADIVQGPAPFLDVCRLTVSPGSTLPDVALDDVLTVKLGFDGQPTAVFSGAVVGLGGAPERGLTVLLASKAQLLAQVRENTSFEQRTLGDLARQWGSAAGMTPGTIEPGPSYPFVAVDDRRSAWEWLAVLGRQCGALSWVDGEGKLHCRRPEGPSAHTYRFREDLLSLEFTQRSAAIGEVTVAGEGAAGSQGAQAWGWLVKDGAGISASAGQGGPKRLFQDGALRNAAAVQSAADSASQAAARLRIVVRARVPGNPNLGVGTAFELADCPGGRGDGTYVALKVRHRYGKAHGYVTDVTGAAP